MANILLDTHCHIDEYKSPNAVIKAVSGNPMIVLAVTIAPSTYERARSLFRGERQFRLALGAHPLHVAKFPELEWVLFRRYLPETTYIGEVGLDFSRIGIASRTIQEKSFRRVLTAVADKNKVLSIHSRQAESVVHDFLTEFEVGPAIFHWYSGPLDVLDRLIASGHYFSINPAMLGSSKGRGIIARIPPNRILVETDGPFVKIGSRQATPLDSRLVYEYIAQAHVESFSSTVDNLFQNFSTLVASVTMGNAHR